VQPELLVEVENVMRIFRCECCGQAVSFTADRCHACGALLAYLSDECALRVLRATGDPVVFTVDGNQHRYWRCLNAAWGCNWAVSTADGNVWCRSCQLTRGRPDEAQQEAVEAWVVAEAAKRRLVHQLEELALPIEVRSPAAPDGLAFDLVYLPGRGGLTGHLDGIITLDLAETDDGYRDQLRRQLGEPFRTVISHLRHEIGHHYWHRLVGQSNDVRQFRRLFGDETSDYKAAIEHFYSCQDSTSDRERFITPYASSHPLEDWAETFAHYLHITDATGTAIAHELISNDGCPPSDSKHRTVDFITMLEMWRPINTAVNAIAESLGAPAVYPFEPSGLVIDKLAFVHQQVSAHADRSRFYAAL
jgi:hypothetical protein